MNTALIFGATGLVGGSCLQQLLNNAHYQKIISIGRSELMISHPKLEHHQINLDQLEQYQHLFAVDHVYCCLGTTLKKAKTKQAFSAIDFDLVVKVATLAKQANVEVFSVISSLGANPSSLNYYAATKGLMEQALIDLEFSKLVIVRPSLLIGERKEHRVLEKFSSDVFKVIKPLFIGPLKKIKPVDYKAVAYAMIVGTNSSAINPRTIYIENNKIASLT